MKRLLSFTAVTFLISWACWLPVLNKINSNIFESETSVLALFFLGAYAPTLIGILFSLYFGKKDGVAPFKDRLGLKKIKRNLILLSLVIGPLLYGLGFLFYVIFGNEFGGVNYGLLPWIPIVFIVSVILGPLAEEFGWRGFALPLLNPKSAPIQSSIIIGFIWALWHAPLFWAKSGTAISGFEVTLPLIALFFVAVIASSFIYTWFFNRTMNNITIAILLHLSMNASGTIRSMLFPEMGQALSFKYYTYYVLILCGFLVISFFVHRFIQKRQLVVA